MNRKAHSPLAGTFDRLDTRASVCDNSIGKYLLRVKSPAGFQRLAFGLLWVLFLTIPWEDSFNISGFGTATRAIGIVALAAGVLAILEKQQLKLPTAPHIIIILFVLWSALSLLWSEAPQLTMVTALTYVQLLVMAWLTFELCSHEQDFCLLFQAYVVGCYVSSVDTIAKYAAGQQAVYERYAGGGLNPNDLAKVMALSIPISYYLSLRTKGVMAWAYRLQLVLACVTVGLTASRGGLLASLSALTIVPLTYTKLVRNQKIKAAISAVLLLCLGLFFVPRASWQRLATTSSELEHGTMNVRTVIWGAGLGVFAEHPFIGVGAGGFGPSVEASLGQPWTAHNTFLSVLVETGVVGFGLFILIVIVLLLSVLRLPSLERTLWIVLLCSWTVAISSSGWETRKPTWFLLGLCAAQCGSRRSHADTPSPNCFSAKRRDCFVWNRRQLTLQKNLESS